MSNSHIVRADTLPEGLAEQTAALLVDSFYSMFKCISKDRETLRRLFIPCMQLDLFHVLLRGGQIAGVIAVSDVGRRAILIKKTTCVSIFGPAKGKMIAWQLYKILSVPAVKGPRDGYIDFIATAPEFKRCGVATELFCHVESQLAFDRMYLDVLAANHPAICLYEKLGYRTETVKKNVLMRLAGIKAMNIMKKELK